MRGNKIDDFLLRVDLPSNDYGEAEIFHEGTKWFPSGYAKTYERSLAYMNSQRALKEQAHNYKSYRRSPKLPLPPPQLIGVGLSHAVARRRTPARLAQGGIDLQQLATILGASAGLRRNSHEINDPQFDDRRRPYPSAGALYPIEIYVLSTGVRGMDPQVAHYDAFNHRLNVIGQLTAEAFERAFILSPGVSVGAAVIYTACWARSAVKYGSRAYRFALLEAGGASYLASLLSAAIGLEATNWGSYFDDELHNLLRIDGVREAVVHCLLIGTNSSSGAAA